VQKLARRLLTVVIVFGVWGIYSQHRVDAPRSAPEAARLESQAAPEAGGLESQGEESGSQEPQFRCDGRTYCSQMTSCAEAKYFLMHCPSVKMDGDHDGTPCERQWCPNG
jgi:hypothetical protein